VETWDAIRARRNVRTYRPDPVPASDLDRITEAGRLAPSASNRQHWDFVVVTDPDQLRALSTVWRGAGHIAGAAAANHIKREKVKEKKKQNRRKIQKKRGN